MKKTTLFIAILAVAILWSVPSFADTHRNSSRRDDRRDSGRHHDSDGRGDSHADHGKDKGSISIRIHIEPKRKEVRRWIPGRYETRIERVYREGYWVEDRIPARYETRLVIVFDPATGGRWEEHRMIMVEPERIVRRYVPGWFEDRCVKIWIEGYWIVTYL